MSTKPLESLVEGAVQDKKRENAMSGASKATTSQSAVHDESHADSLSELKRKFKDVLRAYWRQHKSNHEGEDTDQYDTAQRIATSIFNLYWDKPNYASLRGEKKEILNYFIKHIQLSKTREGQSSAAVFRQPHSTLKAESKAQQADHERLKGSTQKDDDAAMTLSSSRKKSQEGQVTQLPVSRLDLDSSARARSETVSNVIPRSVDALRSIRDSIPEHQLVCSLLMEGTVTSVPDIAVRSEITQVLQAQFGVKASVGSLHGPGQLYHILLPTSEECDALAGHRIRLSIDNSMHTLWRAPYSSSALTSGLGPKKRRNMDMDTDTYAAGEPKRPKLREDSSTGPSSDEQYVVDRVLHQRWVQGKVQYLLQLKGENSAIRVWVFDEDLFAELDSNRRHANLWNASQSGQFPEPSQLPQVEKILGAKMAGSQLMFFVKWANSSVHTLVPSSIVNKAAPEKVIEFYEARVTFEAAPSDAHPQPPSSIPVINDAKSHNMMVVP